MTGWPQNSNGFKIAFEVHKMRGQDNYKVLLSLNEVQIALERSKLSQIDEAKPLGGTNIFILSRGH